MKINVNNIGKNIIKTTKSSVKSGTSCGIPIWITNTVLTTDSTSRKIITRK